MSAHRAATLLAALALFSAALAPVASAETTFLLIADFESGAGDWTSSGLWHVSTVTGSTSFWYGQESTGNYDTPGLANSGTLLTPSLDISNAEAGATYTLSFFHIMQSEGGCGFEHPIVTLVVDGITAQTVYEDCASDLSEQRSIALGPISGSTIQFAFTWDTGDAAMNEFFGWSVDDVVVSYESAAPAAALAPVSASATTVPNGTRVATTISNAGTLDAEDVIVNAHLVRLSDGASMIIGDFVVDVPNASQTELELATLDLFPDTYELQVMADSIGAFPEANEDDNFQVFRFTVGPPDLQANPFPFQSGTDVFVDVQTVNFGGDAGASTTGLEIFDMSGQLVATDAAAVGPLGSNSGDVQQLGPYGLAPGDYVARATADANDAIGESDEGNNAVESFFTVFAQQPDLVVSHQHAVAAPPGFPLHVEALVGNQGNAAAAQVTMTIEVVNADGIIFASEARSAGDLCSGCGAIFEFDFNLPEGEYFVVSMVDPLDTVVESDEGNNLHETAVFIGAGAADLLVTQFAHTPDPAGPGEFITLLVTVSNNGTMPSEPSELGLFVTWPDGSEEMFAQLGVPSIFPGESFPMELPIGSAQEGVYPLRAEADLFGQVSELNESNNVAFHTMVIGNGGGEVPNLVGSIGVGPVTAGELGQIVWGIENVGLGHAGGFDVEVWLDGAPILAERFDGLEPGATLAGSTSFVATPGEHQVAIVVDASGEVAETDENDNVAVFSFFVEELDVPAPADLAIAILGIDKSPVRTDLGDVSPSVLGRRTIEIAACNLGDDTIHNGTLEVQLESSSQKALFTSEVQLAAFELREIEGGACATFFVKWDPAGSLGDVTIVATGYSPDEIDGDASNDVDRYDDFVVVGGFGGVALL